MNRYRPLLAFLLIALFASAASARAQGENLLTNGDFETGAIAPWSTTGTVTVGNPDPAACRMSGLSSIQQTVATTPGSTYYFTIDLARTLIGNLEVRMANPANLNQMAAFRLIRTDVPDGTYTLVFTANLPQTAVRMVYTPTSGNATALVDNIALFELPPSPLAGVYTGTMQTTLAGTRRPAGTAALKIGARILPTGQLLILESPSRLTGGTLLPNGQLRLRLNGTHFVVTPVIRGSRISFSVPHQLTALDEGHTSVTADTVTTVKLTRIER